MKIDMNEYKLSSKDLETLMDALSVYESRQYERLSEYEAKLREYQKPKLIAGFANIIPCEFEDDENDIETQEAAEIEKIKELIKSVKADIRRCSNVYIKLRIRNSFPELFNGEAL